MLFASFDSLLTGIFREPNSASQKSVSFLCSFQGAPDCVRTHLLPPFCPVGSAIERPPAGAGGNSWVFEVSCEPSKRYRQEIIDPFQSRLFSVRLSALLSLCQLYQSVLRRLFRFACRFRLSCECFFDPRQSLIPNSQFRIPNSFRRST